MSTLKTALACLIGAVVFCVIVLEVQADLWWIGIITGAICGYISYMPIRILRWVQNVLVLIPPIEEYSTIVTLVIVGQYVWRHYEMYQGPKSGPPLYWTLAGGFLIFMIIVFASVPVIDLGGYTENSFYLPEVSSEYNEYMRKADLEKNLAKGRVEAKLTHWNAFRWLVKGIWEIILVLAWRIWKWLWLSVLWPCIREVAKALWNFTKFVHSKKALQCAIDVVLIGVTSYFLFYAPSALFGKNKLLFVSCSLFSVIFGVLHAKIWELASKRFSSLLI